MLLRGCLIAALAADSASPELGLDDFRDISGLLTEGKTCAQVSFHRGRLGTAAGEGAAAYPLRHWIEKQHSRGLGHANDLTRLGQRVFDAASVEQDL